MATISEIAELAEVSTTLVSRVINHKPGVSPEQRRKILKIIEQQNYKPNRMARSLVMKKTHTIGVLMDNLCDSFFFKLITAIQETAEALGYNVVFGNSRSNEQTELKYVDFFSQGLTDGIIVYGGSLRSEAIIREIAAANSCFVLIENMIQGENVNNVLIDNHGGAKKATEHLINLGYRKIGHFTGDMNYRISLDRFNGFVQAMQSHSIPIDQSNIITANFSADAGYTKMKELIESGNVPEAIFFSGDRTAFGAIRAMHEKGLKAPDDIAVIGFDDDVPSDNNMVYPGLTTIQQPMHDIGVGSVELLHEAINNPHMKPKVKVFEPPLIIRETCR